MSRTWTNEEYKLHIKAVRKISKIKDEAFKVITEKVSRNEILTDYHLQQFIKKRFKDLKLVTDVSPPIVAVDKNSSNPHYTPNAQRRTQIKKGSWVLIDLWAKENVKDGIFADITWVGYVGKQVPKKYQDIFKIVIKARDKALYFLETKIKGGEKVQGWEVDKVARDVIVKAGFGKYFIHTLGHSLDVKVHGDGVCLKSVITKDKRLINPGTFITFEPGIYLKEFGVRSEIDVFVGTSSIEVTTPVQKKIVAI